MRRFVPHALLVLWAVFAAMAHAQDDREARRKLALEVPIADMHMHLHMMMTPDDLLARMDRNNVRWGGGVGPVMPGVSTDRFIQLLGKRYVPAGAQPELMAIYTRGGTAEMVDAQSASFQSLQTSVQLNAVADWLSEEVLPHMVLAHYATPGAEPSILDNLVGDIRPASRRRDLEPVFSFNGEGLWQGVGTSRAGDPAARLSRWRDVQVKARAEGFD